ncbi:MAG: DEAD/DEAH box helicase family protein [Verrucomicrobiota bacterium JB022]|nr:DEAD/DEAH box helicase family protein [Verrucomicrobiota bacterium JB022]
MQLKHYQSNLLEDFANYLDACRTLGDPGAAFEAETRKHFGVGIPYRPLPNRESNSAASETPFVCLRVPTGGGKTFIAGHAIERVCRHYLPSDYSLTLWLVPTEPIREQTLAVLKDPASPIRRSIRDSLGEFTVMEVSEAVRIQPATLDSSHVIVVSTMAAFKRDDTGSLNVYKENGDLMAHFSGIPDAAAKGQHSFVDMLRLRRPFVVVDEAHNQGTPLALDTISHFRPCAVLELTATPDRATNPSNVLQSISASVLQAEDMLKLPLEVAVQEDWQVVLREALAQRNALEHDAQSEAKLTGEDIRPTLLIQADKSYSNRETMTPERVKQELVSNFGVSEAEIAIVTGKTDELGKRRIGDFDFPRIIITVDKLREGWDCPTAYVLMTFRDSASSTAIEQLVGRILRMPHVKRKQTERLNRAYAYACSNQFSAVLGSLRDGLVQNGFERMEAKDLIRPAYQIELGSPKEPEETPFELSQENGRMILPNLTALSSTEQKRVELTPETGRMVVRGPITAQFRKKLIAAMPSKQSQDNLANQIDTLAPLALPAFKKTPSDAGEAWSLPTLIYHQGDFSGKLEPDSLLQGDWEISTFDPILTEAEFPTKTEDLQRARLSITQEETVTASEYERMEAQLSALLTEKGWDILALTSWIDRNTTFSYVTQDQKRAWLLRVLQELTEHRGLSIEELAFRKFRLRKAIEEKLKAGLEKVRQQVFEEWAALPGMITVEQNDDPAFAFRQGRYAFDYAYSGYFKFQKHFFRQIGNLKSSGEEFECAQWIDNHPKVKWWIRNVERKAGAFWLPTSRNKFYPDFLVQLHDGRIMVVEYKGAHLASNIDQQEKAKVGELWAERSSGKCLFAMPTRGFLPTI